MLCIIALTYLTVGNPYIPPLNPTISQVEEDPNVPRSRLKLAVPFIGKDVPSKSSEFAHPDIIIGLHPPVVLTYTGP